MVFTVVLLHERTKNEVNDVLNISIYFVKLEAAWSLGVVKKIILGCIASQTDNSASIHKKQLLIF